MDLACAYWEMYRSMKIITMVGTSIFTNYLEEREDDKTFAEYIKHLEEMPQSKYSDEEKRISMIKKKIEDWIEDKQESEEISSEIKSLIKLKKKYNDQLQVYFLSSDTILSNLAARIIKKFASEWTELKNYVSVKISVIDKLRVDNRKNFTNGMVNLIQQIYRIVNENWENVVINISAGYKASIPYLTILAQVNKCDIFYTFENTDALIEIPYIPLSINWHLFEENEEFFFNLDKEEIKELSDGLAYRDEIKALIERTNDMISLNPLGVTLWERYKVRFSIFYVAKKLLSDIKNSVEREKIFDEQLKELKRRLELNPNDPDLYHLKIQDFWIFKNKFNNLQTRLLYKAHEKANRFGTKEYFIYVAYLWVGREVHNSENEYKEEADRLKPYLKNFEYETYRIEKGG